MQADPRGAKDCALIELLLIFEPELLHGGHDPERCLLVSISQDIDQNAMLGFIITYLHLDTLAAVIVNYDHMVENVRIDFLFRYLTKDAQAGFSSRPQVQLGGCILAAAESRQLDAARPTNQGRRLAAKRSRTLCRRQAV